MRDHIGTVKLSPSQAHW